LIFAIIIIIIIIKGVMQWGRLVETFRPSVEI
jgi:hypothetical protein